MSFITSDTDRLALVLISKHFLGQILRCHGSVAGQVVSDLPEDTRVLHVYERSDDVVRRNDVVTIVVTSESFDRVKSGERPPIRDVTFTRTEWKP